MLFTPKRAALDERDIHKFRARPGMARGDLRRRVRGLMIRVRTARIAVTLACLGLGLPLALAAAQAETRRAFVVGIERYDDPNIQSLTRADNDAADLAADLQEVGFDKKNVTLAIDVRTRDEFDKKFQAFLKTVEKGDDVFFFFSGHGMGVAATNTNYLLLGGLKSLKSYTRARLLEADRRDDIIALKMPAYENQYDAEEIPKNGIAVADIVQAIAGRKPNAAFLVLDACRSLPPTLTDIRTLKRSATSGSGLLPALDVLSGFLVLYSASYGETAIESFGPGDTRRNSLFTEVLRQELPRPGQTLPELAQRARRVVHAYAAKNGFEQDPEYFENLAGAADFTLVGSIGAERFPLPQQQCEGAQQDWEQISHQPTRAMLERHRRRFRDCPTAELARRALVNLIASPEGSVASAIPLNRDIDACDRLAAADIDTARPPEVIGIPLAKLDFDAAVPACQASIARSPRMARFLYNYGRAQQAAANAMRPDDPARQEKLFAADVAFKDAADRGYIAALYSLATVYDYAEAKNPDEDQDQANKNLIRAANLGFPAAMYELGRRYKKGFFGVQADFAEAYEWMSKAAEAGSVAAMVDVAESLWYGQGVSPNPRRAVAWAERAADAGSVDAKVDLGLFYFYGYKVVDDNGDIDDAKSVLSDDSRALLWFGRATLANAAQAQYNLALMMEAGDGLPVPQPEIAARYFRLAALGGYEDAEIDLAERLRSGGIPTSPESGESEAVDLLRRALSQGSARAAAYLAEIYRNGELGMAKDPLKAMQYAYRAIKLSAEADPTTEDGNPFFESEAGILLAEMAVGGQANDINGRPLLSQDEIDRLQKFYGMVNPDDRKVEVRKLEVPLGCNGYYSRYATLWVWDWGRKVSPTEPQLRSIERQTGCYDNATLRRTLIASFLLAKKTQVPFADLLYQQIKEARETIAGAATGRHHD
jgi:TPR repeat protein